MWAFSRAKARTVARPTPADAPVTTTTRGRLCGIESTSPLTTRFSKAETTAGSSVDRLGSCTTELEIRSSTRMRAWIWAATVAAGIAQAGCATHGGRAAAPLGGSAASWRYDVVVGAGASELRVDAWLPPGSLSDLVVRHGGEPFVRDVEVEDEDGWRAVPRRGGALHPPGCARGCHVRYRFELRRAAEALHDVDTAMAWGDMLEASPVDVAAPSHAGALRDALPLPRQDAARRWASRRASSSRTRDRPDTYEADATNIAVAPYAAFGPMRVRSVEAVPGATLDVAIAPGSYRVDDDALVAWVARSSRTMARFLGCFPRRPRDGPRRARARRGTFATARRWATAALRWSSRWARRPDAQALSDDWVLPHEMAHLAVPSVARRHHWIEEGLAVYMQPIARARSGELTPEQVWREFAMGMPQGCPVAGRPGARRRVGLGPDVLGRGDVLPPGGPRDAPPHGQPPGPRGRDAGRPGRGRERRRTSGTSTACSRQPTASSGAPVLVPMHDEMGRGAWVVDLPRLFRDLGVVLDGNRVKLLDDAPLAAMRRAITSPLRDDAPEPTACRWAARRGASRSGDRSSPWGRRGGVRW